MIESGSEIEIGQTLHADAVIVGSGAGGSMTALELAKRGLRVVLLERGRDVTRFSQREDEMIPELFSDMGGQRTDDLSVMILSGKGLGGSTLHNTNLCKRIDPQILGHWVSAFGLSDWTPEAMAPLFSEVETMLGVTPIAASQLNTNNDILRRGCETLGYRGAVLSHNRDGCVGSGFCELGCAYNAKNNARKTLLPTALALGVRVIVETRAEQILFERGRACGIQAQLLNENGSVRGDLIVRANIVCLAGSAVGSAALASASGVPDPFSHIGMSLRIHPGAAVAGIFEDEVRGFSGIPQSYECTEFLDLSPESDRRVWIVPSFAHPVGTAAQASGIGAPWLAAMKQYRHMAVLAAMVHDQTRGEVRTRRGRTRIRYAMEASDREQMALGVRESARILLTAGARYVDVPGEPSLRVRNTAELTCITANHFLPHVAPITAVHPMGTLPMGADPRTSVTDAHGEFHHAPGLFAVDGSLFPTSIGTPPQIAIYTAALKVARAIASA